LMRASSRSRPMKLVRATGRVEGVVRRDWLWGLVRRAIGYANYFPDIVRAGSGGRRTGWDGGFEKVG
jgi:hypothetical protein